MKSILKPLMMAIPLLYVLAAGQAWSAGTDFKQKNFSCNGDDKKIVGVPSDEVAQILFIIMSTSSEATVKVSFGSKRVLQAYTDANDTLQTSLAEITGNPGAAIKVGCSGNGEMSLTVYYSLSAAP